MKLFGLSLIIVFGLVSCQDNERESDRRDTNDTVSTDSLQNPSYNPASESDSAAKQMNLDSVDLSDPVKKQK